MLFVFFFPAGTFFLKVCLMNTPLWPPLSSEKHRGVKIGTSGRFLTNMESHRWVGQPQTVSHLTFVCVGVAGYRVKPDYGWAQWLLKQCMDLHQNQTFSGWLLFILSSLAWRHLVVYPSGVDPAGRWEQSSGVQCRWSDKRRCQSCVQEPWSRQPVWPQLAQDCPQRGGQVGIPVPGLQTHPDLTNRAARGHRHPGEDGDWEEAVWQRADWCECS